MQAFAIGLANEVSVSVSGQYSEKSNTFVGTADYLFDEVTSDTLYFHLAPNWYRKQDERDQFPIKSYQGEDFIIKRRSLDELKGYHHKNLHLPSGIEIKSIHLNGTPIHFRVKNNPNLQPGLSYKNSLLSVDLSEIFIPQGSEFNIRISFETYFRDLPKGYKRILWDYLPRPVNKIDSREDFGDFYTPLITIHQHSFQSGL